MNPFIYLESVYGHEYGDSSYLAQEYEYLYPLGEVNMGPQCLFWVVALKRG